MMDFVLKMMNSKQRLFEFGLLGKLLDQAKAQNNDDFPLRGCLKMMIFH